MKTSTKSMTEGPILSGVILYTIPIILTSILQLLFNAADMVVVGRYCGSISVAAVGSTGAITNLIVNLFNGLSVGAGVAMAHALGSHNDRAAFQTVHTAVPTSIIGGGILTVLGVIWAEDLLRWMGTPESVLPLSTVYMRICFAGMIFNMIYTFCSAMLRAAGDTKGPLIYLTTAGAINVVLNLVFVIFLHMSVDGVALATIISQGISAVLVVIALTRRTDGCRLYLKKMKLYKTPLRKMITIGLPAGVQGSLFSISNVLIQSSVNSFGDIFMSGNAAAGNIEGFVYVTINSFSQTTLNFVGQNCGAGKYKRAHKILWACLGYVTVLGTAAGCLVYAFAPQLLSIYITDSPEAIAYGVIRIAWICIPYAFCGLMDATTGALRGMGASLEPMIISVLGICVLRIVWIYSVFSIPQYHTPDCLYASYIISWVVTFAIQLASFYVVYRKAVHKDQPSPIA